MLALLLSVALVPWAHPLSFHPLAGWHSGTSGTVRTARNGEGKLFRLHYPESSAWISNVPYRDAATTDPPQRTVHRMPRAGVVLWAVVTPLGSADMRTPIKLNVAKARRGLCCDGFGPPYTREWDLAGLAPNGRYEVSVQIYFGSRPTPKMLAAAQRALNQLRLPKGR